MSAMATRRPVVAANWKMNTSLAEAKTLAAQTLAQTATQRASVDVVVCPPAVWLQAVREIAGDVLRVGAQNMYWEERGAFTGELSPQMVRELCSHVILGHSERRQHFGESDDDVHRKVLAALAHGLVPIVCVGESLAQRRAGETYDWVSLQVRGALHGLRGERLSRVVVGYEPIWAVGTGEAASGEDANAVAAVIRQVVGEIGGTEAADAVRIQYGGSVNGANAAEFLGQPEIDGALVGGASLKAEDFAAIVRAAAGG